MTYWRTRAQSVLVVGLEDHPLEAVVDGVLDVGVEPPRTLTYFHSGVTCADGDRSSRQLLDVEVGVEPFRHRASLPSAVTLTRFSYRPRRFA